MDRSRFDSAWSKMRELWPPYKNQNDGVIKQIYWRRLQKYTTESVEEAVGRCVDESHKFPSVAHIIERIPPGSYEPSSAHTMASMLEAISRKQSADKKIYRVTWLANETGTITGYRLDDPKEAHA